jgi:hypothetical protein
MQIGPAVAGPDHHVLTIMDEERDDDRRADVLRPKLASDGAQRLVGFAEQFFDLGFRSQDKSPFQGQLPRSPNDLHHALLLIPARSALEPNPISLASA